MLAIEIMQSQMAVELVSLILLTITLVSTFSNTILSSRMLVRVRTVLCTMIAYLVLELLQVVAEALNNSLSGWTIKIGAGVTFALAPTIPFMVAVTLYENIGDKKWLVIPIAADMLAAFTSIWTGLYFVVGDDNVYSRGPLFWVSLVAMLYPLGVLIYANYKIRYRYDKKEKNFLSTLYVVCMIGVAIQIVFPTMMTMWTVTAGAVVAFYEFVTQHSSKYDTLTFTQNRSSYAARCKELDDTKRSYVILLADLNNLKYVNDNLGHGVGDKYIITAADILMETYGKYGRVYRIGGDEFAVVTSLVSESTLEKLRDEAQHKCVQTASAFIDKEHVGLAIGYYVNISGSKNVDECSKKADSFMYENKSKLKAMSQSLA